MASKDATETVRADAAGIARAAEILREGGLVAVPTETVYGLAARADSAEAVARIYEAKGRPSFNPLIVHVSGRREAERLATLPAATDVVMEQCWPGPLTLVCPLRADANLAPAVTAGLPTVALRCPSHPVMQALLAACDFPLAAPSANRSGFVSPTSAAHVLATLDGRIDAVLDDGKKCEAGIESTILAIRDSGAWDELRPGPVDLEGLYRFLWPRPEPRIGQGDSGIEAPGQLSSHYAPGKPVRLNAEQAEAGEFLIGFGPVEGDVTLSKDGDLTEAASRLYACLHVAAHSNRSRIAVAPVPETGIGRAINDRLRRAAA
ncbi:MAG: threonylcarbamoyl-AMP synthase [Sphingomonadales bacterium CG12_big_fil_rev_8_21_14_0_65_65_10]|jgi:L-threonylcarbamoyladenylate synthase|nr:MAG: threonylcarbamoyl-AMP synthase [Sphingomonadales bacterium CG12_big_fil_rev_8_21_14_0_65_65_10]